MSFVGRNFLGFLVLGICSVLFHSTAASAQFDLSQADISDIFTSSASNPDFCCSLCGVEVAPDCEPGDPSCCNVDNDDSCDCQDKCPNQADNDFDQNGEPDCLPSQDCDHDGIPNVCEINPEIAGPLCDPLCQEMVAGLGNGEHETVCGLESDWNGNDIPDSCECPEGQNGDSDRDGAIDCLDNCPFDSTKTEAGVCGCGIPDDDRNENGVIDCQENCNDNNLPDICETNPELAPELCNQYCFNEFQGSVEAFVLGDGGADICGLTPDCNNNNVPDECDPDNDQDDAPNSCDACPEDPNKVQSSGICGCGVSDVDSDQDGLADCLDSCPADSNKTSPGACGCGAADTDSDSDGTANCNDGCPSDPGKTSAGVCGCGLPDIDSDENGSLDCLTPEPECTGACNSENPSLDEDGDGVTNCQENEDETNACDNGSFKERLLPRACAGPNGFFMQTNILTVINRQTNKNLKADITYRDLFGVVQGTVSIVLGPEQKRDLIVNDLGLAPDTYGTVCVKTNATKAGAWSGGLTLYKERFDLTNGTAAIGLSANTIFDYALYYPLTNRINGKVQVPLNTNSLGTTSIPSTMVANWVRLTDAEPDDNKGLLGRLRYYDLEGKEIGTEAVALPNGGRFDFDGHNRIGQHVLGMAEFTPSKSSSKFYVESSRYVYEGPFVVTGNFWSAYVIPNRRATGVPTIGRLSTLPNEIAIVELLNSTPNNVNALFKAFNAGGTKIMNEGLDIPAKGSRHVIITGQTLLAGFNGSAEVSGPPESLAGMTMVYRFSPSNDLLLAYAPAFIEPIGSIQRTEFNSFLGQDGLLEIINSLNKKVTADIRVLNFDSSLLSQMTLKLNSRATERIELNLPPDTYGTIVVDSGADTGLVVRNDVSRENEYTLSFPGQ